MRFATAFRALVISYARQEKGRTLLTALGVALGVCVLVAVQLANESAVRSFQQTISSVAGDASLTVRGNGIGLPGTMTAELARVEGVASVAPLIMGSMRLVTGEGIAEPMTLLGVDLLGGSGERDVRGLDFTLADGVTFTDLLMEGSSVLVPRSFADARGIALGATVPARVASGDRLLRIAGFIEPGNVADNLGGRLIVADLAAADELLGRGGLIDRFDVITNERAAPETIARRIEQAFELPLIAEPPEARGTQADRMLAAFRFNLGALGHLSVLVGAFLVFNTIGISVVRRRSVIGTLRAMGLNRRTIRFAFLGEGLALGVIGSVLGVAMGVVLAAGLLGLISDAVTINFFETNPGSVALNPWIIAQAFLLGVGFSLLAAWGPASEAAATAPANTVREGSGERRGWPLWLVGLVGALAAGIALELLAIEPRRGLPVTGYAASLALIAAFLLWSKPLLAAVANGARRPLALLFGGDGLVAAAALRGSLRRATAAIAGLMLGLGMTVSVTVMVASFRNTVIVWMNQVLMADVYIAPASEGAFAPRGQIPAAFADAAESISGVAMVDPFRGRDIEVAGLPAILGSGRLNSVRFANTSMDGRDTAEMMREASARGEVVVSEALARQHGWDRGDRVVIPTPQGEREFRIAGVYHDYSSERGYVTMDRAMYLELFDDPMVDTISVTLEAGASRDDVERELLRIAAEQFPSMPPLAIRATGELRESALRAFDQTFRVTYLLELIAIVVAVLGVTTTLLAQVIDRRAEMGALRAMGASRNRIARIVLLESGLIGIAGCLLGGASGVVLSWILTRRIMLESFGWTIRHDVPWGTVTLLALVVLAATVLAGLIPARESARMALGDRRIV